jgi:hypothetical protein
MIRNAVLVVFALIAFVRTASARTEEGPPPEVQVVMGKVRSLETLTIGAPYQLLIVDITGASTATPNRAKVVPYDPKTACKVAWAFHGGKDLVAKRGDVVGPLAVSPCIEKTASADGGLPWAQILTLLPVTLGVALDSYVPSSFSGVKKGDADALKGLRRLVEVFGTSYKARFHFAVANALVDVRTIDALRFGIESEASTVWQSTLWRYVPKAYEAMEPFVIADITGDKVRRLDLIEALWMLSPTRTHALIKRLLPKHAAQVALYARQVSDPAVFDLLIAHYRTTKVEREKTAILAQLTNAYASLPADDYLEPFFKEVGTPVVAPSLATTAERKKHKLHDPAGLLAYVTKHAYDYDKMKLIKGLRISWGVEIDSSFAFEPTKKIKIELEEDAEFQFPTQGTKARIEAVVAGASTSSSGYSMSVKLAFVRIQK